MHPGNQLPLSREYLEISSLFYIRHLHFVEISPVKPRPCKRSTNVIQEILLSMKQPCCFNETRLFITQSEPMDDVFNAGWAFLKVTVPLKK